jgi:hypothetical protein
MSAKLYYIAPLVFECQENPITLGDDKFRVTVPYDGEILGALSGPAISGHIVNAGTGAGSSTDIQISNVTTGRDYFATEPTFEVDDKDASGRALLSGGMLNGRPTFRQNDVLALDVDALPTNSDSAQMTITLLCGFWREVD